MCTFKKDVYQCSDAQQLVSMVLQLVLFTGEVTCHYDKIHCTILRLQINNIHFLISGKHTPAAQDGSNIIISVEQINNNVLE